MKKNIKIVLFTLLVIALFIQTVLFGLKGVCHPCAWNDYRWTVALTLGILFGVSGVVYDYKVGKGTILVMMALNIVYFFSIKVIADFLMRLRPYL